KTHRPGITVIFGGPEICANSFLFSEKREMVDYFVSGEGEWFFDRFFSEKFDSHQQSLCGNRLYIQPQNELKQMNDITEPYTAGELPQSYDNSIFLEMTRGCFYRCSYCYYSKNNHQVREADSALLFNAVEKGNLSEIYVLSPTFSRRRDCREILEKLKVINKGVSIHTELRPDHIDAGLAKSLFDAGITSLEIGIQTFTEKALISAGRPADRQKTLQGMIHLRDAGISLKIGIIPGLPDDSPEEFMQTISTLAEYGFQDDIEFYPLMVLPGTEIRNYCDAHGYEYQQKPPYYFVKGGAFDRDDIIKAKHEIDILTGFNADIFRMPDLTSDDGAAYIKGLIIDFADKFDPAEIKKLADTIPFTVMADFKPGEEARLFEKISRLDDEWTLYNIILRGNTFIDEESIEAYIRAEKEDSFQRRIHYYDQWKSGLKKQYFQISDELKSFRKMMDSYLYIEPVFSLNSRDLYKIERLDYEPCVLVPSGGYDSVSKWLLKVYENFFDRVAFESSEEMRRFYNDSGRGFVEIPFKGKFLLF
ncbi:MAG: B12-binding domain-containing radical SAM protein, partial [Spirochaetota bacterium]